MKSFYRILLCFNINIFKKIMIFEYYLTIVILFYLNIVVTFPCN